MSISEVQEYVESHDENVKTPHDDLVEMFRTVYDREPDEDDIREGLWSHICAGVPHDGSGTWREESEESARELAEQDETGAMRCPPRE